MKKIRIANSLCTKLFTGIASIFFSMVCFSQERAQADVNITAVTLTAVKSRVTTTSGTGTKDQPLKAVASPENLKCTVTVHSYWDDDASDARLIVVLPVEVTIVSMPSNATVYKAGGGTSPWAGYLVFNLGNMAVQQSITVEFTITKSTTGNNKVSAYAYSATPDPNPSNNYKDATY